MPQKAKTNKYSKICSIQYNRFSLVVTWNRFVSVDLCLQYLKTNMQMLKVLCSTTLWYRLKLKQNIITFRYTNQLRSS